MKWKRKKKKSVGTTKKVELPLDYYHHAPKEFDSLQMEVDFHKIETALMDTKRIHRARDFSTKSKDLVRWMRQQQKFRRRILKNIGANPLYYDATLFCGVIDVCNFLMSQHNDDIETVMAMDGPAKVAEEILGADVEYLKKITKEALGSKRWGLQQFYETRSLAGAVLNAMACVLDPTRPIPQQSINVYHILAMCELTQADSGISENIGVGEYNRCFRHDRVEARTLRGKLHPGYIAGLELRKRHSIGTYRSGTVIINVLRREKEYYRQDPEGWRNIARKHLEKNYNDGQVAKAQEEAQQRLSTVAKKLEKIGKSPESLYEKLQFPSLNEFLTMLEELLSWDERVILNMINDVRNAEDYECSGKVVNILRLPGMRITKEAYIVFTIFNVMLKEANQTLTKDDVSFPLLNLKAFKHKPSNTNKGFRDFCHEAMIDGVWRS